jgi:hypothetical protein
MSFESKRYIYHRIGQYCSDKFYRKYADTIYKAIQEDYLWMFGDVTEEQIAKVVQGFKDFFGEE